MKKARGLPPQKKRKGKTAGDYETKKQFPRNDNVREKTAARGKIVNSPGKTNRRPTRERRKDALAPRAAPNLRPRAGGISGTFAAGHRQLGFFARGVDGGGEIRLSQCLNASLHSVAFEPRPALTRPPVR
ncbi:hypothetical protein NL676_022324 [Syzygium grande]|nr:hypothetical protein NL676_022324 [Syzygium grande]